MNQDEISKVQNLNATTLEELAKLKSQYMEKVRTEGKAVLKREFDTFFAANPLVRVVAWTQYTPYFNDGDACEFSVHELNGGSRDLSEDEIGQLPKYIESEAELGFESASSYRSNAADGDTFKRYGKRYDENAGYPFDEAKYETLKTIQDAVRSLEGRLSSHDDLMEMSFGDHVQVIATPAGFTVREIEHD